MQLLAVRHAIAQERRAGLPDEARALTRRGRRRMERAARGLALVSPRPDVLGTSPLLRARQTADIVAARLRPRSVAPLRELEPSAEPEAFASWLRRRRGPVVVVGHEPHLGLVIAWLIGAAPGSVALKKGGAALLDVAAPRRGGARLLGLWQPRQLRSMRAGR